VVGRGFLVEGEVCGASSEVDNSKEGGFYVVLLIRWRGCEYVVERNSASGRSSDNEGAEVVPLDSGWMCGVEARYQLRIE